MLRAMYDPSKSISRLMDLHGRVALATGGSGCLGTAIAEALAELGARVIITSRDAAKAKAAAERLPETARHGGVALNQLDIASLPAAFASAVELAGQVDILINNAHERTTAMLPGALRATR